MSFKRECYRCAQNSWDFRSWIDRFSCVDDVDAVVLDFVADENSMKTIEPKYHQCLPFLSISFKHLPIPHVPSIFRFESAEQRVFLEIK